MKRFGHTAVGVANGEAEIFSAFDSGGPMWTGTGLRTERCRIEFEQPFLEAPSVHISLSMWDIEKGANHRVDLQAENIAVDGFEICFRTWSDTHVARARARWMAIGPIRHEDDWHND